MFYDIFYESEDKINNILNSKDYVIFKISECTEKTLEEKCNSILNKQHLKWLPLKLEFKRNVHVFIKTFYYKK